MTTQRRNAAMLMAATVATGLLITSGPASAQENPKITAIKVRSLAVASTACRDLPVTFRFDAAGWRVDGINASVSYRGEQVGFVSASPEDAQADTASTTVRWCPSSGFGRFTVGPSQITYHDPQGSGSHATDDATTVAFHVRRASHTKIIDYRVRSSGSATVHARLRGYSPTADRFVGIRDATVRLQTKRAGGHWRTVDTATTGAHGAAELDAKGKRFWRVLSRATSQVARSASATVS